MHKLVVLMTVVASAHAWQLPRFVQQDLQAADEHTLVYHAYAELMPMVQHAVLAELYQGASIGQVAAQLSDDELERFQRVCVRQAGSVERALQQLSSLCQQVEHLQRRYVKADRCRFRPRLERRLATLTHLPATIAYVRAVLRQHYLYFLIKQDIPRVHAYYQSSHTLPHEAYADAAYLHARLSSYLPYATARYRLLPLELEQVCKQLTITMQSFDVTQQQGQYAAIAAQAQDDLQQELMNICQQARDQQQQLYATMSKLQTTTRRFGIARAICGGAVALATGVVSFGLFCGVELIKAATARIQQHISSPIFTSRGL